MSREKIKEIIKYLIENQYILDNDHKSIIEVTLDFSRILNEFLETPEIKKIERSYAHKEMSRTDDLIFRLTRKDDRSEVMILNTEYEVRQFINCFPYQMKNLEPNKSRIIKGWIVELIVVPDED